MCLDLSHNGNFFYKRTSYSAEIYNIFLYSNYTFYRQTYLYNTIDKIVLERKTYILSGRNRRQNLAPKTKKQSF